MAKLIIKSKKVSFGCYSERGILSYFMFRYLPSSNNLQNFLENLEFPANNINPFKRREILDATLFSELEFGNRGFGNPDGAIFLKYSDKYVMIFLEGKFNETYEKSCDGGYKNGNKSSNYNSKAKGQLELRWRMISCYNYNKTNLPSNRNGSYLIESYNCRNFYNPSQSGPVTIGNTQHLYIKEGVGDLFNNYIKNCLLENIYFLLISPDDIIPYDNINVINKKYLPELFDYNTNKDCWNNNGPKQFCWYDSRLVEAAI